MAVGSSNPAKVQAARAVVARLWPSCEVRAGGVPTGVRAQPVGDEETRRGALERARRSRSGMDADLGIGLEGGVAYEDGRTWLLSWAAVVDRAGRAGYAGARMELPAAATARLRAGEELAPIVDDLFGTVEARSESGAIGLLTRGLVTRSEWFAQLIGMALAPHLQPERYPGEGPGGRRA